MKYLIKGFNYLVVLLTPIIIILGVVRLVLSPMFLKIEYRMPNFPEDEFGFTIQDRLYWAELSRQYLVNDAGIEFLEDLKFDNGSPIYNERELNHMSDVKRVLRGTMDVLLISSSLMIIIGLWAVLGKWWKRFLKSLESGGMLTSGLIIGIIFFLAISFNTFFVGFHKIFFKGDTWLFKYSDTLIRLFPVRFWMDTFIIVGVLSLLIGGGLAYFIGKVQRV
ncbi:MAG TPA: TIGR01906 family membrane protein [Anaerolineae bacterium]|nr:TIGR01906 family membrane protein [Anaerolineae bacterium]